MPAANTWIAWLPAVQTSGGFEVQAPDRETALKLAREYLRAEGADDLAGHVTVAPLTLAQDTADLRHENRRLRKILDTLSRAGVGKGALIEFYAGPGRRGVSVCRADADEAAFLQDCRAAIDALALSLGMELRGAPVRSGVTAEDPHQGGDQ